MGNALIPSDGVPPGQVKQQLVSLLKECFHQLKIPVLQQSIALGLIAGKSETELIEMAKMLVMIGKKFELVVSEPGEQVSQVPLSLLKDRTA